jgi:ACDE family multidrug resistance protein
MKTQPTYILFFIGLLPIIMVIGNSMFIPLLPQMQLDMGLTTIEGGWLLTSFSVPAALLVPLGGIISDRYGRKKVALIALPFIMVGCFISAFAGMRGGLFNSFHFMLIGRVLQGIGAGAVTPLAMVFITDIFQGEQRNRALGSIEVFNGMGKVISPIIGGVLLTFSWTFSFVVFLAIVMFAFVGILMFIRAEAPVNESSKMKQAPKAQMKQLFYEHWRWIIPIFTSGAIGMFLLFGYLFYFAYLLEERTISSLWNGIFLAVPVLMLTTASHMTGIKLKGKADQYKKAVVYGLLLMFVGSSLMVVLTHEIHLFLLSLVIFSGGFGILLPAANAALASILSKKERGTIFSLYAMLRFFGVALGPLFFGIWILNVEQMVFTALFFMSLNALVVLYSWPCLPVGKECAVTEL